MWLSPIPKERSPSSTTSSAQTRNIRARNYLGRITESLIPDTTRRSSFTKEFIHEIGTAIASGQVWHGDIKNRAKDGSFYWIAATIVPFLNEGGKPRQYVAICADITASKHAEEAGAALAALVNSSDDAIVGKTLDGVITTWNPGAEKIFGYSATEAIGQSTKILFPPEDLAQEAEILMRIGRGELVKHFDTVRVRKDGTRIHVSVSISPVTDHEGRITGASKIARDITERIRAEEALRQSEQNFHTMADAIPHLAWIARADGWIYWYNRRWYDYTGTTPEQMEGWGWQRVHDPVALPNVLDIWQTSIATGKGFEMILPLRGSDGLFRSFLTRGVPLKDTQGHVLQWFGTNTDISEQKKAEEEIRQLNATLEKRVQQRTAELNEAQRIAHFGNWYFEVETNVVTWSEELYRIYGLNPALPPPPYPEHQQLFTPESWQQLTTSFAHTLESGTPYELTLEMVRPDGNPGWMLVRGERVNDATGNCVGMRGVSLDITERKLADARIQQLNEDLEDRVLQRTAQLEAANKELEAFAYSVSHDLRAPLRGVNGYVSMLQEDCAMLLDAEGKRLLDVVSSEAKRMGRLIDDLLTFSRLGRQKMGRTTINMTSLVRGEFESLTRAEPTSAPRFELETLPEIGGDLPMLRQVFANLLGNAIKFSRPRPSPLIEVGSSYINDEITFHVRDNGVGFDEKYLHKLFGVFQRLHSEEEFEGTGVGLALVQSIIHRHGGKVWAESKPNEGATFYFTLPTQSLT